jgi:CheY-like chemotaxis protein
MPKKSTARKRTTRRRPASTQRRRRPNTQPVVAVVNTNDDLVQALRTRLIDEGVSVVPLHIRDVKSGRSDFGAFLRSHDPVVVIYDVAIPYDDNWTFLSTLRRLPESGERRFVITTVNKRVMEQKVGPTDAVELIGGHADDFEPLVEVLRRTLRDAYGGAWSPAEGKSKPRERSAE